LWLVELWIAFAEPAVIESIGYRDLKGGNKIIRRQQPEFPPSENRGERGILSRGGFSRVKEKTGPAR
jgi:hypothetical protein